MGLFIKLQAHVFFSDQRAEFWFVVEKVKAAIDVLDECMASRHWDVCDSDLAFVAAAQLDSLGWDVLDDHYAFWFLAGSFQDDVISVWFFERKHLNLFVVDVDDHWKLKFADLTVELFKVVMKCASNDFLFDFEVNPFHETVHVNSAAGAWAFAGVEKVAFFLIFFFETNLAGVMFGIFVFRGIELHNLAAEFAFGWGRGLDVAVVWDLTDVVLNSA